MEKKAMYECLFIVDSTLGEEGINAVVTKFTGLVEANATAYCRLSAFVPL